MAKDNSTPLLQSLIFGPGTNAILQQGQPTHPNGAAPLSYILQLLAAKQDNIIFGDGVTYDAFLKTLVLKLNNGVEDKSKVFISGAPNSELNGEYVKRSFPVWIDESVNDNVVLRHGGQFGFYTRKVGSIHYAIVRRDDDGVVSGDFNKHWYAIKTELDLTADVTADVSGFVSNFTTAVKVDLGSGFSYDSMGYADISPFSNGALSVAYGTTGMSGLKIKNGGLEVDFINNFDDASTSKIADSALVKALVNEVKSFCLDSANTVFTDGNSNLGVTKVQAAIDALKVITDAIQQKNTDQDNKLSELESKTSSNEGVSEGISEDIANLESKVALKIGLADLDSNHVYTSALLTAASIIANLEILAAEIENGSENIALLSEGLAAHFKPVDAMVAISDVSELPAGFGDGSTNVLSESILDMSLADYAGKDILVNGTEKGGIYSIATDGTSQRAIGATQSHNFTKNKVVYIRNLGDTYSFEFVENFELGTSPVNFEFKHGTFISNGEVTLNKLSDDVKSKLHAKFETNVTLSAGDNYINHSLGERLVNVVVADSNYELMTNSFEIILVDENSINITLPVGSTDIEVNIACR